MFFSLLKSKLDNPTIATIQIIYNGESDPNEKRDTKLYYNLNDFNLLNLESSKLIIPSGLNVFLIRHAQGYHNLNNTIIQKIKSFDNKHILKDPQLTTLGIQQAKNCGKFLKDYHINIKQNSIYFCSILLRTRETISEILNELDVRDQEVIILPQSHEISNFIIPEKFIMNNGQCNNDVANRILYKCDFNTGNNGIYHFNWDYYSKIKNKKTKLSHMLYEAYIIIAMMKNKDDKYINELRNKLI